MNRRIASALIWIIVSLPVSLGDKAVAAGASPEMVRNNAALALVNFPWHSLQYQIVFRPPLQGYRAMTFTKEHKIEIYARPEDGPKRLAHDIAHELGHAVDVTFNTSEMRRKWMEYRGINPATPWFGCNRCSDYKTPSGDFAETFASLILGNNEYFAGRIVPPPTEKEIPKLISYFTFLPQDAFPERE